MDEGAAFYIKQGDTFILKLVGDIRYTMGCALGDFLDGLFARTDYDNILVDLTEAHSVDSTSLGLLARIANFSRERFAHKTTLLSTNPDVNQILDNMGFYEIFDIIETGDTVSMALRQLSIEGPCKDDLTRIVYEAHRTLSDLNPRNQEAFKNVLDNLRTKLGNH
ncbi:MAG TPA: STAS domain-containing protein [Candidatus Competibacteraceae bacterium]|nr:STAS domain-containing protein [Candidatus Competibacteraceae bacterium]HQA27105.1 STAS domain-containing protein [Candidatus Competibacteraceae bacterium]HQD56926.1 STAS domain-containing protein [Candidatus Competibacteraceae bacterium]